MDTGTYWTVVVFKYYATGDFEKTRDCRSLIPGNQNGSGYKYISLAFSTKENLDI
jgi:hypothetical protein